MRLDKVQVTHFRCIEDSTEFKVSDITCLVGKNESGKTTILQAIEPLNPQNEAHTEYDLTRDYRKRCAGSTFRIAVGSVSLRFDLDRWA